MLKHDEDPEPRRLHPWKLAAILAVLCAIWALHVMAKMQDRVGYLETQFQRLLWGRSDLRVDPPKENRNDG